MGIINRIKYYTKSIISFGVIGSCAIYGIVELLLLSLIGKHYLSQWGTARFFYYVYGTIFGLSVKIIDEENINTSPAIFISNHQSMLDIFMLGRMFPQGCTVTAKKSLKWIPVLGWFMSLSGTLFLDRSNNEKSVALLNNSLKNLKDNKRSLWIFPEGTRSRSKKVTLLPFKKGAFYLAQQGKIPIVPVIVSNTSPIFHSKSKIFNKGLIKVKVLKPISTVDLKKEDVNDFSKKVYDIMEKEIKELGYSETGDADFLEDFKDNGVDEKSQHESEKFATDDQE